MPMLERTHHESVIAGSRRADEPEAIGIERMIVATIKAAKEGGITRKYFEEARRWEACMRQSFFEVRRAIAREKNLAEHKATELLKELGKRYKAIWPDTKFTYPVFYSGVYEAIQKQDWWASNPPGLFGSTPKEAEAIGGVVREALVFFISRGSGRNFSLLSKWLQFCFPDTFAIYDSNAARSIEAVLKRVSLEPPWTNVDREQFQIERIGITNGAGYNGLLNFYRLFWDGVRSAGLQHDLQSAVSENESLLRSEPNCWDARVSGLDILDKLLWKANGSAELLGIA